MTKSLCTLALLLIVFCLLLSLAPAHAAALVSTAITLTTGNDEAVTDGVLSLREALDFANHTRDNCYTSGEKMPLSEAAGRGF